MALFVSTDETCIPRCKGIDKTVWYEEYAFGDVWRFDDQMNERHKNYDG